jgi:uncharacterized protein YodC (DUF2158 family)
MDSKIISFDRKESNFTGGDLVVLKSGGPVMTVRHVSGGNVVVDWFVAEENYAGNFLEVQLFPAVIATARKKIKVQAT